MDKYKIYPKQYRNEKITVQKNKCFVLMQFSEDLDLVYGTIKDELDKIGFICNRADDVAGSPIIFNKILTEMFSSRFIIVELSHNNPNVFYELGIAHSFKESSNIIIIKQKSENAIAYPFDLKHLQYIEYTPDNLKLLTYRIKEYISNNKYLSDFYEILNIKGIIPFVSDNQDDFVEYLRYEIGNDISLLTEVLNGSVVERDCKDIETLFSHYEDVLTKTICNKRYDVLEGVIKIYFELLYQCPHVNVTEIFLTKFLSSEFDLSDSIGWKIDLLCKLVLGKKMLNICLPWIVQYFSKLRAAHIDLNRYKLERLLLTCNYDEINECIMDALFSPNCLIRESMADIIGEKRLKTSLEILYNRLEIEENNYVCRSIVEAIGRIDNIEGINRLLLWFKNNCKRFEESKYNGIYNHMACAIKKMDTSIDKKFISSFINQYKEHIDFPDMLHD